MIRYVQVQAVKVLYVYVQRKTCPFPGGAAVTAPRTHRQRNPVPAIKVPVFIVAALSASSCVALSTRGGLDDARVDTVEHVGDFAEEGVLVQPKLDWIVDKLL